MRSTERLVIYVLLALLLTVNAIWFLGSGTTGSQAIAGPSPIEAADLGPAAALLLEGKDGTLKVENRDGRIAWGKDATSRVHSTAFVAVGRVIRAQQSSDSFQEEAELLAQELGEADAEYRERLDEISSQLQTMEQETPEFQQLFEEGEALFREYQEWGRTAMARRDQLGADQIERSYRELTAAVDVVAERLGIDVVHRFIPTEEKFEARTIEQAVTAVRLRSVLHYPEAMDITSEVMSELDLTDVE